MPKRNHDELLYEKMSMGAVEYFAHILQCREQLKESSDKAFIWKYWEKHVYSPLRPFGDSFGNYVNFYNKVLEI